MNVYNIEMNNQIVVGNVLVAANDYNEAEKIFNEHYSYATNNPIKDWKCCICLLDTLQTNVTTPKILLNFVY